MRTSFGTLVLVTIFAGFLQTRDILSTDIGYSRIEKQRYDGWYNNLAHPHWGAVDSRLVRKAPSSYSDGVYALAGIDRPSARKLSRLFMKGQDGLGSKANRTALLAFFGQVVANEIVMASESGCPIEMHKIDIDKCDDMYDIDCRGNRYIPFLRAAYDRDTGQSPNAPREQINQMTAWIDGSFVYSTSEAWLSAMRSFQNGTFLSESEGQMPIRNAIRVPLFNHPLPHVMRTLSPERLFLLGDPRTNQNPALLSFGILFLRWHNVLAKRIKRQHSDWSDEDIFQRSRRIVIASLQNIIFYEYLPIFLGSDMPKYTGYKQDIHPGIGHTFQAAAFRFGHTMIPPGIYRRDGKCNFRKTFTGYPAMRLCSMWWDSNEFLTESTMEEVIMGLASQISEREDSVLCSDVRDKLFGPMEFTRRDLGALNIMRGRDNGLPDYNSARVAFGLPKKNDWLEINPEFFAENPDILSKSSKTRRRIKIDGAFHIAISRLCSMWWDSNEFLTESTMEEVIMGLASQISEREDSVLCSDVRDKLFGPMEFTRRDLGALNIMRGRDNGLPDYNSARVAFGLPKKNDWLEINPEFFAENPDILSRLIEVYKNRIDNIDVYVGGMLESYGRPGELFNTVIKEQFIRIRDADRFWFENSRNGIFTTEEIAELRKITLWDVIVNSTDIGPDDIQKNVFIWNDGNPCPQPLQLNASELERCSYLQGYDYFSGSELTFIYACVFLGFVPIFLAGAGYCVVKLQNSKRRKLKIRQEAIRNSVQHKGSVDKMVAREWLHANHKRLVTVKFGPEAAIHTVDRKGEKLRSFSLKFVNQLTVEESQISNMKKKPYVLLRIPNDHDLVLELDSINSKRKFIKKLEDFLILHKKEIKLLEIPKDTMLGRAETRERRQRRLEHFFREAYALTFGLKPGERRRHSDLSTDGEVMTVMRTSLSKTEFAAALGMKANDMFVRKMFNIVDKDQDGRISFQEFLETVVLFSRGKTEDKLRIIFDMCDNDKNGVIDKEELSEMMRSLVEIARTTSLRDDQVTELIDGMFQDAGLEYKNHLTYQDFKLMMKEYKGDFVAIGLDCKGAKQNFLDTSTNIARMTSFNIEPLQDIKRNWMQIQLDCYTTFLEENRQNIFYLFLFYVVTIVLFVERFIHYSFMAEHTDLRHIMGVGIAITRGSAASLSFCYSLLLLTMSRNLITKLKEFPIQQYLPLDSHIQFHKIVACTALFFSFLHTIGHIVNFYHVSTQSVENLHCLTREVHFASDYKPNLFFWLFQTVTGVTGVLLFIIMTAIFVFAHPTIRKRAYNFFWNIHALYIALYILCLMHGLARLTGPPRFWMFFLVPGIIYTLDKIVSLRTKYMALDVIETDLLPSDVIKIKFYRPPNLKYLSGQWVRLSCTAFRPQEMHSFTLTSAPHENFLSCHIKAQGPWTWKLRNYFDPCNYNPEDQPKIRIEGPFGGGNQDWYKFEVAVMVGGGIGVTPYASILNDLVFGTSTNRYSGVACKKVYFLWICPSHKHFEWFIDVLRDVEKKDVTNVLEIHIFITQFFHKFDLRTTMLYICENHFQRLAKTSIFTGLKAVNHFGRPDMSSFLKFVQKKHSYVSKIGVFSCGPRPLTKSVMSACDEVNKGRKLPYFIHHFENFG